MKARVCPHGSRECEKGSIRNDSAAEQFNVIRLLLSLTTVFEFSHACVDVERAYLQSGEISREINVWAPPEIGHRNDVWKLRKLPYGISEAGRQWMKAIEQWMTTYAKTVRVPEKSQMHTKYDEHQNLVLLFAKVTDDILLAVKEEAVKHFCDLIKCRLKIRKTITGNRISFNGGNITKQEGKHITVEMTEYLASIECIQIPKKRKLFPASRADEKEVTIFRKLASELVCIGCPV